MANTAFKVENGLLVVGSANVAGSLSVGGEFNISGNITFSGTSNGDFRPINNNYSLGNSTNRWSLSAIDINVSNTATLNLSTFSGQSTFSANLVPNANNIKLGDSDKRWDLYANNANVVTIGVSNTATVNGTLIVNPGVANAIVVTGNSTHSNVTITSNSTQFFSNVIFDTNVLFVDAVNNRVGVATITPDAGLTVATTANVSGAVVLGSTLTVNANASFSNNVTISGNLIVSGTTTYVNTATLNVADNIVTLNADITGATAPTESAGIEINRGSSANVTMRWNESNDIWDLTEDGTNFYQVVNRNQTANATFAGIVSVLDSVTNTSILIAASANSVKTVYDSAANASNISSGTLATARLPATANVSTQINVGANVNVSTTLINVGNSTVNTSITSSSIFATGTLQSGNTTVTGFANVSSTLTVGGNTVITDGKLTVNGDIITTGSLDSTSDARVKTNIRPIVNALDLVLNLEGVVYDRTDTLHKNQMGLIAQQILPYVPEVVHGNEEEGYTVSYPNLVALLVEAIKDLNKKINNQKN
jgi:hypothetical protein